MKTANRVALIYGVSLLGAAGVSYFVRQRKGQDLLLDTLLHGAIAGTALNVVGFLVLENGAKVPVVAMKNGLGSLLGFAQDNDGDEDDEEYDDDEAYDEEEEEEEEEEEDLRENPRIRRNSTSDAIDNSAKPTGDMGKTPRKAVELLSKLNTTKLYADLRENGVKISEVPENPSIIMQEED